MEKGYRYWGAEFITCPMYNFKDKELCLRHYITYMLNRTQKIFEYKGLPDTIPKRMLESMLQVNGFVCVAKHASELYAFWGGLGGMPDVYYQPTICVVANPALNLNKTFEIDKDCVIIRNDAHYYGLLPLFRRYASALVENDISFRLASINTRIQSILSAPDSPTKEACEQYLDDVEAGDLGVIQSNEFLDGVKAQNMSTALRTFTDLIEYQQYLKASWFNEIGLNANYNMKREKLSTTESQMNNDALLPLVDEMLESRREGVEKVNAMFGTNIEVSFASSWEKLIEEFQAEMDDLRMGTDGESNQLDRGEDNESDGNSESAETDGDSGTAVDVQEVHDSSLGEEQREDGASETSAESDGDGDEESGSDDAEVPDEVGDTADVEVNVTVNVEVNDDAEGQTESDEPDESLRDSESDE